MMGFIAARHHSNDPMMFLSNVTRAICYHRKEVHRRFDRNAARRESRTIPGKCISIETTEEKIHENNV